MADLNSWNAVRDFLVERYRIENDGVSWLRMLWSFPGGHLGQPTLQSVEVTSADANGRTWIRILAVIAHRSEIDLEACLKANFGLVVGSIGLDHKTYALRHHLCLPVAEAELEEMVELVPRDAATLRERLAPEARNLATFVAYAE